MFKKILITNLGEIACRIIKTARGMVYAAITSLRTFSPNFASAS